MVATPTAVLAGLLGGIVLAPVVFTVYTALMQMQEAIQQDIEDEEES